MAKEALGEGGPHRENVHIWMPIGFIRAWFGRKARVRTREGHGLPVDGAALRIGGWGH